MRPVRLLAAVVLLAAATFAVLLAADLGSWRDALRAGDAQFAQQPASARWAASTTLPFDPAFRILDLSGPLAFRRAARSFVSVLAAGNGLDNGYSESRARGALEEQLTNLARGPDRRQDSAAENLLGILAFVDHQQHGPSAPAPVDRSVADFQSAVELDPSNEDAKSNLELLLRELVAKGVRPGTNGSSSGPAKGHQGAGGGLPGRGY
jgi:hypothetical protein